MAEFTSESAPTIQAAIELPSAEIRIADVSVEKSSKPKQRKPRKRAKVPRSARMRLRAVRFPASWTAEWRTGSVLPVSVDERRRCVRLPGRWAASLRARPLRPVLVERSLSLPDSTIECDVNTKRIVEAILFAANRPLTIRQIQEAFSELERPDALEIQTALEAIAQDYMTRPIGLMHLASGYRFQIREGVAPWVSRLFEEKPARYSRALLETLSIIAYRQPVTRGDIEDIRGVSVSSGIIHTLLEREWIRVIAHKEVPGRPALYGTTKQFLDYFNLASLSELPPLEEIGNLDFSDPTVQQENRERPQTESPAIETSDQTQTEQSEETSSGTPQFGGAGENRTLH